MSQLKRVFVSIAAQRNAIIGWVVVIVLVGALISHNRAVQVRTTAALASSNPAVQESMVRQLVQQGRLSDALAATQDPSSDATSKQNVESVALRQSAASTVNTLIASHQVSDNDALAALFLLYKDSNSTVKSTAAAGLAVLGKKSKANQEQIVANLSNGDPDIRAASVAALDAIGGTAVAGQVDKLMQSPDATDAVQAAMQGLGSTAVPFLLTHMDAPDVVFRQSIIRTLGAIGSPMSLGALEKATADPDPSIRRLAQSAVGDSVIKCYSTLRLAQTALGADMKDQTKTAVTRDADRKALLAAQSAFAQTKSAAPTLIATLRNTKADNLARTQSALALGRLGGGAAVQALVASLGDYDTLVRNASLQGVQSVGPDAVGALTTVLGQGTDETRASVVQALGAIGTPSSIATVRGLVENHGTSVAVRLAGVQGLGQSGSVLAVPVLVAALSDPDGGVVSAASDGLISPDLEAAAVPLLVSLFSQPSPVPFSASQTLSRMGGLAVPALRVAAQSPSVNVQTWAAVTLGLTDSKDRSITAALTPLTRSGNVGVQYAATQALGRLAGGRSGLVGSPPAPILGCMRGLGMVLLAWLWGARGDAE